MSIFLMESVYQFDSRTRVWARPNYAGIAYSDGDNVEERIGEIIAVADDVSVLSPELRKFCTDWPSRYHLGSARANILRPLKDVIQGAQILEIGAGCGAITRYLGESGAQVLALEGTPRRAAIARSRTRDLENVTVLSEQFAKFQSTQKFDVITLIGVLEYANLYTQSANPTATMLDQVRNLLKPDGKLIIAIENQLGLKYFSGVPEDHISKSMYGIEGRYRKDQAQTFGKKMLTELMIAAGFTHSKFFAPFPDYKLPASIITEKGCHTKGFDAAAFAWLSVRKDYQLPPELTFSLELVWNEVFKNGLGMELANSFLILASPEADSNHLTDSALAYHYSTERRPQFCKETQFYLSSDNKVEVRKDFFDLKGRSSSGTFRNGIDWIPPKQDNYVLGHVLAADFVKTITSQGWKIEDLAEHIKRYLDFIADLMCVASESILDGRTSIPGKYLDALPSNIIIDGDGKPHLIDDEWHAKEDIEFSYLLFRVLTSFTGIVSQFGMANDPEIRTMRNLIEKIFSRFGLSTDDEDIKRYLRREEQLQIFSTGQENISFDISLLDQELPGVERNLTSHWLKERLLLTEQGKAGAEKLALARLFELEQLNQRLLSTEAAKENAERLAFDRLAELSAVIEQLSVMSAAKEFAERLALERLEEIKALNETVEYLHKTKSQSSN